MIYRTGFLRGVASARGLGEFLLGVLVLCGVCGIALGQSGRRSSVGGAKPGDATPAQSQAGQRDDATASNVNPVESPKLSLFVADHFSSDEIPSNIAREIVQSFYGRLRERSPVVAVTLERDMSR